MVYEDERTEAVVTARTLGGKATIEASVPLDVDVSRGRFALRDAEATGDLQLVGLRLGRLPRSLLGAETSGLVNGRVYIERSSDELTAETYVLASGLVVQGRRIGIRRAVGGDLGGPTSKVKCHSAVPTYDTPA